MKPFLAYGWQPQVMAVEGSLQGDPGRARSRSTTSSRDPGETRDLAATAELSRPLRTALREYPVPSLAPRAAPRRSGEEERRKLASLGYVSAGAAPVVRKDAPRPAAMAPLFDTLDTASTLFVREEYARVIPLLRKILAEDPYNLDAALRLATAHSALGQTAQAEQAFDAAATDRPGLAGRPRLPRAPLRARPRVGSARCRCSSRCVAESPDRLPALEALARLRERQGRAADALALWQQVYELRPADAGRAGAARASWRWRLGQTALAIDVVREGARGAGRGASPTTSSWACSTSRPGASRRRATRSTACPRRTRATRWRSSSARR